MTAPTCLLLTNPTKCWFGPIGGVAACAGMAIANTTMAMSTAARNPECIAVTSTSPVGNLVRPPSSVNLIPRTSSAAHPDDRLVEVDAAGGAVEEGARA